MAARHVRIATLQERAPASRDEIDAVQLDIAQLRAEVDRLRTAAGAGAADTGGAEFFATRSLPELRPGTVQLSYAMGNERVYLWARDAQGIRAGALALSARDLERELTLLAEAGRRQATGLVELRVAKLSALLLPRGSIPEGSAALEIVAEGKLASVPFAALHAPAQQARLLENHTVTMINSLFDARRSPVRDAQHALHFVALQGDSARLRGLPAAPGAPALQGTPPPKCATSRRCSTPATRPAPSNYCAAPMAARPRSRLCGRTAPTWCISPHMGSPICVSRWRRC